MPRSLLRLVFFCATLLGCAVAHADERILAFHSDIVVAADGSMVVTETIRVRAEGTSIRRGIVRDFPTRYRDRFGNLLRVGFEVLEVTRDGRPEPYNAYPFANGVRVDFGTDAFLRVPADYEYGIRYRTTRQLGFFEDHDELYWNVTGVGSNFAIDSASATVTLPQAVPATDLMMEGFTGPQGARGRDYTVSIADGQGSIRTTRALPPHTGLTLVLSWPKGVVAAPTALDRAGYLLADNRSVLIAVLTLLGSALWLFSAWRKVGRDPEPGVIFPHYEPPEGYSPGAARYVASMGYDNTAFTAALVDLAVKGHMRIAEDDGKYVLERRASPQPPTSEERVLCDKLFDGRDSLALVNTNHAIVGAAQTAHVRFLKAQGFNRHWINNTQYLLPSIAGSLVMAVAMFILGAVVPLAVGIFVLILVMHLVFGFLLRAPTVEGRKVMDRLEGLKLYLDVAEKGEIKLRNPPQITPELFEKFLPFAIALGVEQAWSERFERALAQAPEPARATYRPLWYSGVLRPGHTRDFTRQIGSGFNSAIASAATAPGTSSGRSGGRGGGGFSGGGGGGGGVGGR